MSKRRTNSDIANSRRITQAEADRLGVKYSKKLRVPVGLTRINSKTKFITEREWIKATSAGEFVGKGKARHWVETPGKKKETSKEKRAQSNLATKKKKTYKKGTVHYTPITYHQLTQLMDQAQASGDWKFAQFMFKVHSIRKYKSDKKGHWFTTPRWPYDQWDVWEEFLQDQIDEEAQADAQPIQFGVIFSNVAK